MEKRALSSAEQETLQRILQLSLTGVGAGAAARGLIGIKQLFQPELPVKNVGVLPTALPIPVAEREDETMPPSSLRNALHFKAASARQDGPLAALAKGLAEGMDKEALEFSDPRYNPLMIPLAVFGPAAGIYGGWKGLDMLLRTRKKQELADELSQARGDYHKSLLDQHHAAQGTVKAAELQAPSPIDELYDAMEKQAKGYMQGAVDGLGGLGGAYLTAVLGTALGSGKLTYDWFRSRSQQKRLEEALRQRAQQRWLQRPQTMVAVPVSDADPNAMTTI